MRILTGRVALLAVTAAVLSLSVADSNAERCMAGGDLNSSAAPAYSAEVWQLNFLGPVPPPPPPGKQTAPKCPPPLKCQ
jgi:hypothetical protein